MKNVKLFFVSIGVTILLLLDISAILYLYSLFTEMDSGFYSVRSSYFDSMGTILLFIEGYFFRELLFPYFPLLVIIGMIFVIIKYSSISLCRFKKIILFSFIIIVVVFCVDIFNTTEENKQEKEYATKYNEKYEFNDIIKSDAKFIYLENYTEYIDGVKRDSGKFSIVTSKIDGSEKKVIRVFDRNSSKIDDSLRIEFISSKGTYFLFKNDDKEIIYETSDLTPILDVCAVESKLFGNIYYDCPEKCKWSVSEKYLACQYGESSKYRSLVLFDIESKKHREIYKKTPFKKKIYNDYNEKTFLEGFSWDDEVDKLYYDKDRKIYALINVAEFVSDSSIQLKIENFSNLKDCNNIVYFNKKIYCLAYANEVGIDLESLRIKNSRHDKYSMNDIFIISQDPYNKSNPIFKVINKYPLNDQDSLHLIDEKYILYNDNNRTIINLENGRLREIAKNEKTTSFYIKEDENNIFNYLTNVITSDESLMPVRYNGN